MSANTKLNARKKSKAIRGKNIPLIFALPSIAGLLIFYIAPFIVSIYNAVIDNPVTKNFVGLRNFKEVITNSAFVLAVQNTLSFLLLCIPLIFIIPLFLAVFLNKIHNLRSFFCLLFLLPLVIPSGSIVFFWQKTFGLNGWINAMFFSDNPVNWLNEPLSLGIVALIFIWKNAGYNIVLFMTGLNYIPSEYYECASIEGAGAVRKFLNVTLIYLIPTGFLVFMMSLVNSFKAFKEIYMLSGPYPSQSIYMLQHYMYNQFSATDYQKLASSSYILTIGFVLIVIIMFRLQKRISENF